VYKVDGSASQRFTLFTSLSPEAIAQLSRDSVYLRDSCVSTFVRRIPSAQRKSRGAETAEGRKRERKEARDANLSPEKKTAKERPLVRAILVPQKDTTFDSSVFDSGGVVYPVFLLVKETPTSLAFKTLR
jgi:hypothetical protein